mmetsp:Transcript_18233/g.29667  ORF Transcript_18233/g.29667 Transcript_18233/m.29667 type:complete len:247 (-) Transcript_18233:1994-2734(-)
MLGLHRAGLRVGTWLSTGNTIICESVVSLGCLDWIAIDNEHSAFTDVEVMNLTQVANGYNVDVIVRLENRDPYRMRKFLDMGVAGIMLPNVQSVEEIQHLREHMFYPPRGKRGFGFARDNKWGKHTTIQKDPYVIAQIESPSGVEASKALAKQDWISSLFVGPYDLSASLGDVGNFKSPAFQDAVKEIEAACAENETDLGAHSPPEMSHFETLVDKGYVLVTYGYDVQNLQAAYSQLAEKLRGVNN